MDAIDNRLYIIMLYIDENLNFQKMLIIDKANLFFEKSFPVREKISYKLRVGVIN